MVAKQAQPIQEGDWSEYRQRWIARCPHGIKGYMNCSRCHSQPCEHGVARREDCYFCWAASNQEAEA